MDGPPPIATAPGTERHEPHGATRSGTSRTERRARPAAIANRGRAADIAVQPPGISEHLPGMRPSCAQDRAGVAESGGG